MPSPHKVLELLSASELEELDAFARERRRSVDECWEWMQARGYAISRGAVGNWKAKWEADRVKERMSRSGELARTIKDAVKGGEFSDVADAAATQLTQVVFEQASRLEAEGEIDPLDVQRMTRSLANLVGSKGGLVKLLAEQEARQKTAVEEASKVAASGASGEAVVNKVREILGIS